MPIQRVWVECTRTYFRGGNSGIQRVVRNVVEQAALAGPARGLDCQPLVWAGFGAVRPRRALRPIPHWLSMLRDYGAGVGMAFVGLLAALLPGWLAARLMRRAGDRRYLQRLLGWVSKHAWQASHRWAGIFAFPIEYLLGRTVAFGPGDLVLLLDAGWGIAGMEGMAAHARARGAQVGLVVYDLIPIEHPALCSFATRTFAEWLDGTLAEANFVISISDATRLRVLQHAEGQGRDPESPPTGVFRLGANLDLVQEGGPVRESLLQAVSGAGPCYLTVGTLEPRKNHHMLLDVFERLWAEGSDARLIVVGTPGWRSEYLKERITLHPENDRRLFLFGDLSDDELSCAYEHASAVLCASFAEGFGLPVVEALTRGVPVFASNLPSHREIGGSHCAYFSPQDAKELSELLLTFESSGRMPAYVSAPDTFSWPDWRESTAELLDEATRLAASGGAAARR